MLILHREALRLRRVLPDLAGEDLRWTDAPSGVLRFRRGGHFECVVNPSDAAVPLPAGARVLLASAPLMGSALPPDTAAWLAPPPPRVFTGGNT
jgi:alpha-glucosidase